MPRPEMSQNLRDLMQLWRDMDHAIDRGDDRATCLNVLESGLRVIFTPLPDTDPRLWRACQVCQDTGYLIVLHYPRAYGGNTAIRFARPCSCAKGDQQHRAIVASDEAAAERRRGVKKTGWTRA